MHFIREKFCFQVTFVVKAVSAFSAAVFLMQAEQCQGRNLSECSQISNIVHFIRKKFCFQVTFVVKAVSAFSAAVFLMQAEQCQGRNLSECSQISNINLQQEILSTLSRLSFTSQQKAPFELQGTSIHVTHDGQLISNKYVIFHIRDTGDVSGVSSNYTYWDILHYSLLMRKPLTLTFWVLLEIW